jgi:hypothetical protein
MKKTATTTVKSGSNATPARLGRPAKFIPLGTKGQKFTITKLMERLRKAGTPMTRVQVTQRVNALVNAKTVEKVDKIIAGAGRPQSVFKIVGNAPKAADFKRKTVKAAVKLAKKKTAKAKPAATEAPALATA